MTGVCALVLVVSAGTAGAASSSTEALETRLSQHVERLQKSRSVIRFFDRHAWLLKHDRFKGEATRQLALHTTRVRRVERKVRTIRKELAERRAAIRERQQERRERRLAARRRAAALQTPAGAICAVFKGHCRDALAVARCESNLSIHAQNGQYLGLFQMGSYARGRFGHGWTPLVQARAAHRYFVQSGRDWSPWTCKPWW